MIPILWAEMQRTGVKVVAVGRSPALSWGGAEMGTPPRWQEANRQHVGAGLEHKGKDKVIPRMIEPYVSALPYWRD